MPRKTRELIKDLEMAGFVDRGGKGSRRNSLHTEPYQERAVRRKIEETQV
jgi:predicted RNA binding protein YcfA (HicA-like mRNA interferase family)